MEYYSVMPCATYYYYYYYYLKQTTFIIPESITVNGNGWDADG